MTTNELRFILLLLGISAILAIYLWDRIKKKRSSNPPLKMSRKLEEVNFDFIDNDDDVSQPRLSNKDNGEAPEDELNDLDSPHDTFDEKNTQSIDSEQTPVDLKKFGLKLKETDSNKNQEKTRHSEVIEKESQYSFDLEFKSYGNEDREGIENLTDVEAPKLLIQINVIRKNQEISLSEIESACKTLELVHGKMGIFHRIDDKNQILFSIASAVEPGIFPKKADESFHTPGVSLFSQFPNARDGMIIFADMLNTANRFCSIFKADLLDENQHKMTKQSIDHLRENILEHSRKIRLNKNLI